MEIGGISMDLCGLSLMILYSFGGCLAFSKYWFPDIR